MHVWVRAAIRILEDELHIKEFGTPSLSSSGRVEETDDGANESDARHA